MAHSGVLSAAVGAGGVAGSLLLGLAGRLATALVAVATGNPANLSVLGTVEVLVLGAGIGAIGGALLPFLRSRPWLPGRSPGVFLGAVLFLVMVIAAVVAGRIDLRAGSPVAATLMTAGLISLVYGVSADALFTRFQRRNEYPD